MTNNLLAMLSTLKLVKVTKWAEASDEDFSQHEERSDTEALMEANVVTSRLNGSTWWHTGKHAVLLDLDVPAYLVPSSTPGHSHLYIDVACPEESYYELLDALVKCGVLERGYVAASKAKGGTCLRLPWVKKGPNGEPVAA